MRRQKGDAPIRKRAPLGCTRLLARGPGDEMTREETRRQQRKRGVPLVKEGGLTAAAAQSKAGRRGGHESLTALRFRYLVWLVTPRSSKAVGLDNGRVWRDLNTAA